MRYEDITNVEIEPPKTATLVSMGRFLRSKASYLAHPHIPVKACVTTSLPQPPPDYTATTRQ
jgi:hypothetical protein